MKEELSLSEARRISLTAQGFNGARMQERVGAGQVRKVIEQLGLLQIDSVNVLVRAHYLPLYSRLGAYDRNLLDALMAGKPKRFFEYWGHEASLLPVDLQPLFRWRMARARQGKGIWKPLEPFAAGRGKEAMDLLERIRQEGPVAASDLSDTRRAKGMWVWSASKHALEWLFWAGLVAATHRRDSFERVYDLPGRVLPQTILALPTPDEKEAKRALLARAARALGVATANDLRDYYRLSPSDAQGPLAELVEEGTVRPVRVRGWQHQAYLHAEAHAGRKLSGTALLSPFDPLVWHRPRAERLFGFRYRLEIYTPAHKREHGYYVLPFLMDGALVGRVDLKADRKAGSLIVQRATFEPDAPVNTPERLLQELRLMAAWLGLSGISLSPTAALEAPALKALVR